MDKKERKAGSKFGSKKYSTIFYDIFGAGVDIDAVVDDVVVVVVVVDVVDVDTDRPERYPVPIFFRRKSLLSSDTFEPKISEIYSLPINSTTTDIQLLSVSLKDITDNLG